MAAHPPTPSRVSAMAAPKRVQREVRHATTLEDRQGLYVSTPAGGSGGSNSAPYTHITGQTYTRQGRTKLTMTRPQSTS